MARAACMFRSQGISYFRGMVFHLMSLGVFRAPLKIFISQFLGHVSRLRSYFGFRYCFFFFISVFLGEGAEGKSTFRFLNANCRIGYDRFTSRLLTRMEDLH